MPNTKLSREALKNHFEYGKWVYVALIIVTALVVDLVFESTRYQTPRERKVDIELVAEYSRTEGLAGAADTALLAGQAFDPTLEAVNFLPLLYSATSVDYDAAQKFFLMIGAQEGHIYFLDRPLMESIIAEGGAAPLDTYLAEGVLSMPEGADISRVTYCAVDDYGEAIAEETHIYAIPLSGMTGMTGEEIFFDASDKYAIITSYAPNADTAARVLSNVIAQFTPEKTAAEEGTNP